jgi:hypothetical protein
MTEDFPGVLFFSVHLSLWVSYLELFSEKHRRLSAEALSASTSSNGTISWDGSQMIDESKPIHKSESEFSLGLNRSESLALNLSQYGKPCFMNYSVKDILTGLINENSQTLMVGSSIILLYYAISKKGL